jgi:hypothetical protein
MPLTTKQRIARIKERFSQADKRHLSMADWYDVHWLINRSDQLSQIRRDLEALRRLASNNPEDWP